MGFNDKHHGNSLKLTKRTQKIPSAVIFPRSWYGGVLVKFRLRKPAIVVRQVIDIGSFVFSTAFLILCCHSPPIWLATHKIWIQEATIIVTIMIADIPEGGVRRIPESVAIPIATKLHKPDNIKI